MKKLSKRVTIKFPREQYQCAGCSAFVSKTNRIFHAWEKDVPVSVAICSGCVMAIHLGRIKYVTQLRKKFEAIDKKYCGLI